MDVRALNMFMNASLYGAAYAMVFSEELIRFVYSTVGIRGLREISDDKDSAARVWLR